MKYYRLFCYGSLAVAVLFAAAVFWVRTIKSSSAQIGLARYLEVVFYIIGPILVLNLVIAAGLLFTKRARADCLLIAALSLIIVGMSLFL